MVKPILQFPDSRLLEVSREATIEEANSVAKDLVDTLKSTRGIGLAAVQIGVHLRVMVTRMPGEDFMV